jgi:hypothetical protein
MCIDCGNQSTVLPIGDTGDQGNNGNYIVTSVEAHGANCTNGGIKVVTYNGITNAVISTNYICNCIPCSNGTNAFKFIKDTSTSIAGLGLISIAFSEVISCGGVPRGCLADGAATFNYGSLQIQILSTSDSGTTYSLQQQGVDFTSVQFSSGGISIVLPATITKSWRIILIG